MTVYASRIYLMRRPGVIEIDANHMPLETCTGFDEYGEFGSYGIPEENLKGKREIIILNTHNFTVLSPEEFEAKLSALNKKVAKK